MRLLVAMGLILTPILACRSPEEWRKDADEQVYEILTQRRAQLGLDEGSFTIEPPPDSLRQRILRGEDLGPLDLVDCLEIAAENNREYQDRRERLYLAALDLTLERYRFEFQPSVGASAAIGGQGKDATATVGASAGFTRLLGNGTEIMLDIGERNLIPCARKRPCIRFCCSTREHDLRRARLDERGNRLTRLVDERPRTPSLGMYGRRIADHIQRRRDSRARLRAQRRRSVVIEICARCAH